MSRSTLRILAAPMLAAGLVGGVAGVFPANAVEPPPNDLLGQAENASAGGCNATTEGDIFGATGQPGEPTHFSAGSLPRQSAWTKWTSPVSDTVVMNTVGSDYDTILAVYRGSRVGRLTRVAADDDSGGSFTSRVTFQAAAGVTYKIAVDSFGAAEGNYLLNIRC